VNVVADWYGKTVSIGLMLSGMDAVLTVVIKSGIRQGGILSRALFNIYDEVYSP